MNRRNQRVPKELSLAATLILLGGINLIVDSPQIKNYMHPKRSVVSTKEIDAPEGRSYTVLYKKNKKLILSYPPYTLYENNGDSHVDRIVYSPDYTGNELTPEQADSLWELGTK